MPPLTACLFCALLLRTAADPAPPLAPALTLWQRGQSLMVHGDCEKAIPCFQQSLKLDPDLARNHLSLAAAYADQGEDNLCLLHLGRYVQMEPSHLAARLQYADMLVRLDHPAAACAQYERFLVEAQERDNLAEEHLVHCHTALAELYEAAGDTYREHLNRGLGLYILACQRATLPDPDGECSVESLLFRAAGELTAARRSRHKEARACWYLHQIWSRLGQQQPAARWLRAAQAGELFGGLTPAETQSLHLAGYCAEQKGRK